MATLSLGGTFSGASLAGAIAVDSAFDAPPGAAISESMPRIYYIENNAIQRGRIVLGGGLFSEALVATEMSADPSWPWTAALYSSTARRLQVGSSLTTFAVQSYLGRGTRSLELSRGSPEVLCLVSERHLFCRRQPHLSLRLDGPPAKGRETHLRSSRHSRRS